MPILASEPMLGVFSSGSGSESARRTCGSECGSHGEYRSRQRSGASPRIGGDDGVVEPMKRSRNKSGNLNLHWIGLPTVATMWE